MSALSIEQDCIRLMNYTITPLLDCCELFFYVSCDAMDVYYLLEKNLKHSYFKSIGEAVDNVIFRTSLMRYAAVKIELYKLKGLDLVLDNDFKNRVLLRDNINDTKDAIAENERFEFFCLNDIIFFKLRNDIEKYISIQFLPNKHQDEDEYSILYTIKEWLGMPSQDESGCGFETRELRGVGVEKGLKILKNMINGVLKYE